jgi:hypothetical protein
MRACGSAVVASVGVLRGSSSVVGCGRCGCVAPRQARKAPRSALKAQSRSPLPHCSGLFLALTALFPLAPRIPCAQVQEQWCNIGKAANLFTLAVYGGTPYDGQESALRQGVDVVVSHV